MQALARVALRRIEHFYYKTDAVYGAMRKLALQQKEAANAVQVCWGSSGPWCLRREQQLNGPHCRV
jgi:hypothetical protein